jgi:serine protease Do
MSVHQPVICRLALTALCVLPWGAQAGHSQEPPAPVLQAEQARVAAMARALKSAVCVFESGGNGGGSGVVITPDGFALSNFHVVKPTGTYMQCGMADGRLYDAVLVGIDPTGDVAMIKLLGRDDFPAAELGDSDQVRVGDWCFAVGNPFLLATDLQPTISYGIVSGVHRYQPPAGTLLEYTDCLQTDAAINPGNSGGPLFDSQGRLIGINGRGSFEKRGRVNVGVGYAISINQIKQFLGHLHSGRIVDHATLGATVATDERGRVIVSNILDTSDAYRRGLRFGDQVLSFAGRPVTTVNGFKNVLGTLPRGWRVPLTFRHEEEVREVSVRLAGVHAREELLSKLADAPDLPPGQPPLPKKKPPADGPPKDGGEPDQPQPPPSTPLPPGAPHPREPIPERVAQLIEERAGYANYYFNAANQQRVWAACIKQGDFHDATGKWLISGKLATGAPFEITLDHQELTGQFPSSRDRVDPRIDLDQQLVPVGSGGLLPALALWRRLLVVGPQEFGEMYYLGTAPLLDHDGLFDVLIGTHNVVEGQFSFDVQTGQLAAVEMFPETNTDPCEVYFSDYRPADGRVLPHHMTVRYGDSVFAELLIERYELAQ